MSLAAMTWAFGIELRPAALKFLLISLADNADDQGRAFPAIATLCAKTSLDRKTVIAGLDALERRGLLSDTGKRVGRTSQVKVYRLVGFASNNTENGTVGAANADSNTESNGSAIGTASPALSKSTENGINTGNGTLSNSTVFPCKESQKRSLSPSSPPSQTLPPLTPPILEPSGNKILARAKRSPDTAKRLPEDFELTAERYQIALAERLDPVREFANFRDHWSATSGARARKHNWDAAWRIWCRKAADMSDRQPPRGRPAEARAVADANELQALKDRRAELGLAGFRDPYPHESADAYRTAQRLALQDRGKSAPAPKALRELLS